MNLIDRMRQGVRGAVARVFKFAPQIIERVLVADRFGGQSGFFDEAFRRAYARNQWAFICTKVIAQNFAQIDLGVFAKKIVNGKAEMKPLEDHFITDLIERPNAYMTEYDLKFLTLAYMELTGDAFWKLARLNNGRAGAIVNLRPDRVTIKPGTKESGRFIDGYVYRVGDHEEWIFPEDMIHFRYPNPNDDYRGQSTLEAMRNALIENDKATEYNKALLANSAMPKGGLTFDQNLEASDYRRIRRNWNQNHQGVENANKLAIFEMGSKWTNIGMTNKDMDFLNLRKMTRDDIAAAFGLPPVLVNSYERATYNNARVQVALFWHETMIPKTVLIKQTLVNNAHKFFGTKRTAESTKTIFAFDLSQVWALRQEELDRTKADTEQIKIGRLTINESRERDNLEPRKYGDVWWRPATLVPTENAEVIAAPVPAPIKSAGGNGKELQITSASTNVPALAGDFKVVDRRQEFLLGEWKGFVVNTDFFESRMKGFARSLFEDQLKQVLKNLRAIRNKSVGLYEQKRKITGADIDLVLFDLDAAIDFTEESSEEIYARMAKSGGQRAFIMAETSGVFDLGDPIAQRNMLAKQQKFATEINKTTWNKLRVGLSAGIEEGATIQELERLVQRTMKTRIRSDALTIARTEVIGVMNGALNDGYSQTGVVKARTWITAGDGNERDTHSAVNGVTKELGEKFTVGSSKLEYPGDPDGEAKEVINCRCTTFPEVRQALAREGVSI